MKLDQSKKKKLISFVKMHGDGNDFVIIDNRNGEYDKLSADDYVRIANRRTGIGCDQVITLKKSKRADCRMIIRNTDGSKAEMCGNAARCVAHLLMDEKAINSKNGSEASIEIITGAIVRGARSKDGTGVRMNMGKPLTEWNEIPLTKPCDTLHVPIGISGSQLTEAVAVNMGNPHIVFFVKDVQAVPLEQVAPQIEKTDMFKNGVNISVAQMDNDTTITARIWERGVGITQSCGSASCAIFVASLRRGHIKKNVKATIKFPGGKLLLEQDTSGDIFVSGSVCYVFDGTMYK